MTSRKKLNQIKELLEEVRDDVPSSGYIYDQLSAMDPKEIVESVHSMVELIVKIKEIANS